MTTKKKISLKETKKYKDVIDELKHREDGLMTLMFEAVCGFGEGFDYQMCRTKKEREKKLAEDHAKYFDIPEIEEFFKDEDDARLFFGINKSPEYVLQDNHYGHWFFQGWDRPHRWEQVEKIINDACMRIYGKEWGKQKQKVPNLIDPIGKAKAIPAKLKNKQGKLDFLELDEKGIVPYLINRKVYYKDTFIGTVKEVKMYYKYLFSKMVENEDWEDDEPRYYKKDFNLPCTYSLILHEYNLKKDAKPYVEFTDWIGNVIPMMDFHHIYVTDDKIVLKDNVNKLLDNAKDMAR